MSYQISRATNSDLALMQRLFYQTVTTYGSKIFTKEEVKIYSKLATNKVYWKQKFTSAFIYNAKLNGEIIGSISMNKQGVIEYIFVHQNYHRLGIAKKLYEAIEKVAKKNDIQSITVQVNTMTLQFFKKNDFEILENIEKISGGGEIITYNGIKRL